MREQGRGAEWWREIPWARQGASITLIVNRPTKKENGRTDHKRAPSDQSLANS